MRDNVNERHIREHAVCLASEDVRNDQAIIKHTYILFAESTLAYEGSLDRLAKRCRFIRIVTAFADLRLSTCTATETESVNRQILFYTTDCKAPEPWKLDLGGEMYKHESRSIAAVRTPDRITSPISYILSALRRPSYLKSVSRVYIPRIGRKLSHRRRDVFIRLLW